MKMISLPVAFLLISCAGPVPTENPSSSVEKESVVDEKKTPTKNDIPEETNRKTKKEEKPPAQIDKTVIEADPSERIYPWIKDSRASLEPLWKRFPTPSGYKRIASEKGSFANWLRNLPLKPGKPPVHYYDGRIKSAKVHAAVLDLDVGKRDLQQCADSVMRLRAEYLWNAGRVKEICFHAAAGYQMQWKKWRLGFRPPKGKKGPWEKTAKPGNRYGSFRGYLNKVFGVANTASILKQLEPVEDPKKIEIGDVFIEGASGGMFGHAVLVMDVAQNANGQRIFLLSQSYMPAQESHILLNHNDPKLSPWYLAEATFLATPEWSFPSGSLKRFVKGCGNGR